MFNPFTKELQIMQKVGGKHSTAVETLTGNKTLVPGVDPIYQYLDPNDVNRVITLANGKAGDSFVIKHNGNWSDINFLEVKVGATTYDKIYVGIFKTWVFDGSNWLDASNGTGYGGISELHEMYRGIGKGELNGKSKNPKSRNI